MGYGVTFQYVHTMCCDQIVVIGISTAQTLNTSSRKQFKDNYMVKTENADTLKCYCERPQRNPVKGPKTHPPRRQFPWQGKEDRGKIRKGCHCHHLQLWRESDPGVTLDPITGGSLSLLISSSTSLFRTTDILLKSKISWVKNISTGFVGHQVLLVPSLEPRKWVKPWRKLYQTCFNSAALIQQATEVKNKRSQNIPMCLQTEQFIRLKKV